MAPRPTLDSWLDMPLLRLTRHSGTAPEIDLGPYEEEVARTLHGGFRWLYFPAPLERLFERETQQARSSHLVAIGILWIVMAELYSLVRSANPAGAGAFGPETAVRLAVVIPTLIGITFAVWWGVRPFVRELLMMVASIVAPASIILVVVFARGGDVGVNRGALTIILLFITVVVRLRFWFATAACFAIAAVQMGVPSLLGLPVPGDVPLVLVTIGATLVANYTLEREYRLNYLQRLHSRIQGAQLAAMVDQLHDLSHRDPLTGLANRRAMDTQLEELCRGNERFAVIMLDIDAFKSFNDRYGHQIGDDCLRRVAAILRASLRFTSDKIARMGGEEFAVVLPQTSLADASIMAERMRRAVQDLQIPHVGSSTGSVVTISAGVSATTGPTTPTQILAEADKALYRAKSLGRNCVAASTENEREGVLPVPELAASA